MPSHAAMTAKFLSARPEDDVEATVAAMKKAGADFVPVVDQAGVAVGTFSYKTVLENLLPVSVTLNDGIQLDVTIEAAPGIAKRLKKVNPMKIGDLMNRKFAYVTPDAPLWEVVNLLMQSNAPLVVVEGGSGKALGLVTAETALDELNRMKDSEI